VEFEWEIKGDPHPLSVVRGLAVDRQGNLYAVDCQDGRIQKFDSEGTFLTTWGSEGAEDGEFWFWTEESGSNAMGDVAVDRQGHVYVADAGNTRIQIFDGEGQLLGKWGEFGSGNGQFHFALGVAVGPEGDVYVTDSSRENVQRFDSQGQFLGAWSVPDMYFGPMVALAVDGEGNVYVPAADAKQIHEFDSEGKLLGTIGEPGSGDGQFGFPVAAAVDSQGNLYVADESTHCVQKFDAEGNFLAKFGSQGTGRGEFSGPTGLAVAADGSIFVADGTNRIQKFQQR